MSTASQLSATIHLHVYPGRYYVDLYAIDGALQGSIHGLPMIKALIGQFGEIGLWIQHIDGSTSVHAKLGPGDALALIAEAIAPR